MMIDALQRTHALNLGPDPMYAPLYTKGGLNTILPGVAHANPGIDFSKVPLSANIEDRRWDPKDSGDETPSWGAMLSNMVNNMRSYLPTQQNADIERSAQIPWKHLMTGGR